MCSMKVQLMMDMGIQLSCVYASVVIKRQARLCLQDMYMRISKLCAGNLCHVMSIGDTWHHLTRHEIVVKGNYLLKSALKKAKLRSTNRLSSLEKVKMGKKPSEVHLCNLNIGIRNRAGFSLLNGCIDFDSFWYVY